ncbi:MAG: hypothetical protein E7321_08985 [Clostridiales bacterium]|nr:hypothetical protein [Clostridiales bacterium]
MKKKIAMVALWLAALVCCLMLADKGMRRDDGARKYGAFFADKQGFDVLFLGTSRVLDAVQPMELWRDYGFTSYNMGNNSEPLGMTRWVLDLAMDYHTPKIAVIDVFYMLHELDEAWTYTFRHLFLDEIPLGKAKIQAVRAALPESEWLEFLMPFSLYHGRWDEILSGQTERLVDCEPYMMGAELRNGRVPRDNYTLTDAVAQTQAPGAQALREIAALCRDNGVEPVFIALPGHASEEEQMAMNSVGVIAQELGVPFLNMMRLNVIDLSTDCYDWQGHLNPDGASKTTAYLGAWLTEQFALEDKRGKSEYAYWDKNLEAYEAYRKAFWE